MAFLEQEKTKGTKIYPPIQDVHSWSHACEFKKVKVVILGQDPYHGPNQAHGLCFSVKPGVATPPSLRNMYVGPCRPTRACSGGSLPLPLEGGCVGGRQRRRPAGPVRTLLHCQRVGARRRAFASAGG